MLHAALGTLTFVMTDIEGSTQLWELYPEHMGAALIEHENAIDAIVSEFQGQLILEQGEGDSTFSVFPEATSALLAADRIRREFAYRQWPGGILLKVRCGIHSGQADLRYRTYYGRAVNRAARIRAAASGGQILISRATKELLDSRVQLELVDHGKHRLKDLLQPEHLFELQGDETLPPPRTLSSARHNLPLQLTSFVGRQRDIENITRKLEATRLLTLLGTGGGGKTRLALQVAAEVLEHFPDGVFFVELVGAGDRDSAEKKLLSSTEAADLVELASRKSLVILDNCEHIAKAVAELTKELLTSGGEVRILATSREQLGLAAENLYRVPTLTLPLEKDDEFPDLVKESEAVQLLADRVQAKDARFEITPSNCRSISRIVRRLDGIPLAIELAASKLSVLSPDDLLARLADRFKVLRRSADADVARHQTLIATIEYSFQLLTPTEREFLLNLAPFRNGWRLDAADFIADKMGVDSLELLERLQGKSLIQQAEREEGTPRWLMLETIREYSQLLLKEAGKLDEAYLTACDFLAGLNDFSGELPNVSHALDFCDSRAWDSFGLKIILRAWRAFVDWGNLKEAMHWNNRFRSAAATPLEEALACEALGITAFYQNDSQTAEPAFERTLQLFTTLGDRDKVTAAKNNLGMIAAMKGDLDVASELFSSASQDFRNSNQLAKYAMSCINLAVLELDRKKFDACEPWLDEAERYSHLLGSDSLLATLHINRAAWAYAVRRLDAACAALLRAGAIMLESQGHHVQSGNFYLLASALAIEFGFVQEASVLAEFEIRSEATTNSGRSEGQLEQRASTLNRLSELLSDSQLDQAKSGATNLDELQAVHLASKVLKNILSLDASPLKI